MRESEAKEALTIYLWGRNIPKDVSELSDMVCSFLGYIGLFNDVPAFRLGEMEKRLDALENAGCKSR